MKIKLIKISAFLTLLRPLSILLIFLIFPFKAHLGELFVTISTTIFLGSYLLLTFVIKRYSFAGYLTILSDKIDVQYLCNQCGISWKRLSLAKAAFAFFILRVLSESLESFVLKNQVCCKHTISNKEIIIYHGRYS